MGNLKFWGVLYNTSEMHQWPITAGMCSNNIQIIYTYIAKAIYLVGYYY